MPSLLDKGIDSTLVLIEPHTTATAFPAQFPRTTSDMHEWSPGDQPAVEAVRVKPESLNTPDKLSYMSFDNYDSRHAHGQDLGSMVIDSERIS